MSRTPHDDLRMMQEPHRWPHLIGLPVKKRTGFDFHRKDSYGVLLEGNPPRVVVGGNVWNAETLKGAPVQEYKDLVEVAAEWMVD